MTICCMSIKYGNTSFNTITNKFDTSIIIQFEFELLFMQITKIHSRARATRSNK